jgi:serine/threonine-protein kinase/endoribonuclease IRE1
MDVKGDKPRGKASSDIFSMGCLFFTYLTQGRHPFSNGSVHTIPLNIIENKQFLESNLLDSFYSLLFEIVSFNEYILLVNV